MRGLGSAASCEFEEAVEDEAYPGEDEQAPVEAKGLVLRGGWKMRHEDEEIEDAAEEDCGELLEETGEHWAHTNFGRDKGVLRLRQRKQRAASAQDDTGGAYWSHPFARGGRKDGRPQFQ